MTPDERRIAQREWSRRYREANRDKVRAAERARSLLTRDQTNAANRADRVWTRLAHRAAHHAYNSNRRAERLGIPGRLTGPGVKAIQGPCAYCRGEARGWDHVIPMSAGGPNTIENLVPCCFPCNQRKNRYLPAPVVAA